MDTLRNDIEQDKAWRHRQAESAKAYALHVLAREEQNRLRALIPSAPLSDKQVARMKREIDNAPLKRRASEEALTPSMSKLIEQTAQALNKRLGIPKADIAFAIGYWIRKAPYQERQDLLQSMALDLLYQRPANGKLAFAMCRSYLTHWYKSYNVRRHGELDRPLRADESEGAPICLADTLIGVSILDRYEDREFARSVLRKVPKHIRRIVRLKVDNPKRLSRFERETLSAWARKHEHMLIVE
ncbi:MAG: hypothetical protein QUS09_09130 [Methanotrichaceae archaeon]|nr:hypothetical protein [Methanotrichaceae archaeon]